MSDTKEATEQLSPLKRALFALEKMQAKVDALEKARTEPIAIIGLGCRFPGGANDPDTFWEMLHNGGDAISEVPPERWDMDDYYDPKPATPGKIVTRLGGFLDQVDQFDAEFFGITPREAISLDPQQRVLLEVAWEALEDADVPVESLADSETGVFVGMMTHDYTKLHLKTGDLTGLDAYYATGTDSSFASGRLSYVLGLHGPSMTLDTACSSSLVAVHLGVQSLRAGECQLALAGGVDLVLSPEMHVSMSRFQALSPDGRCKTFDASADGFGRGEGCGVVVLKRLSDAQKDGDRILAVIRGSAVNHDGPSGGLTVPNGVVQQALIRRALQNGGVKPAEVSYLEAHGTGTALGDPIEARAFTTVLGEGRTADQPLYVASLKTNIGHPGAVAGVAGLIKVVLSLQHEEIPPHLHLRQLSPHISWGNVPVVIPQEPTPWPAGGQRRVAGVSSFGLSGTNAHVVVEESEGGRMKDEGGNPSFILHPSSFILPLSARSPEALRELARDYAHLIRQETAGSTDPRSYLTALCYTASVRRTHHKLRRAFVCQGADDLLAQLDEFSQSPIEDAGGRGKSQAAPTSAGLVFVFSGQGSQWIGMGQELLAQEPVFRAAIEECDRLMRPHVTWSLLEEVTRPNEASRLNDTEIAQPAIFAFQVGLTALWRSWGIKPSAVVGHSVGEIAAAYVSGAISLADACRIITQRGRLMQGATGKGKMLATRLDTAAARQAIVGYEDRLAVAVNNSPISTVLSGDPAALQEVQAKLEQQGVSVRMLRVNYAFHSYQVTEYGEQLQELLSRANLEIRPTASVIPMYSTVTGREIDGRELTAAYWRRNVQEPVLFGDAITALAELGYSHYVEVSPHPVLSGNVAECLQPLGREAVSVSSLRREQPERPEMLGSLATLYQLGYTIEWRTFFPQGGQLVKLPLYPWQRQRYWLEPVEVAGSKWQVASGRRGRGLLGERVKLARPGGDTIWENVIGRQSLPYLADHRFQGAVVLSGAVYVSMALAAAELYSSQPHSLKGIEFHKALFLHENEQRLAQVIVAPAAGHDAPFYVYSQGMDEGEEWTLHAAGHVHLQSPVSGPGANGFKPGNSHLTLSLRDVQARCAAEMGGEAYYAALRPFGFDYGPAFQGLERVWHGGQETLALVRVPESLAPEVSSYRFHPAVLDSALQAAWPVLFDLGQGGNGKSTSYIPTRIGRVQLHSQPNQLLKLWSHAVRQTEAAGGDKVDVDVRLYDETGLLVAEVTGIAFERLALQIPAGPPSAAAQLRSSAIMARVTAAASDERLDLLESYLKQEVAKVTRLSVSRLDAGQPLTRLGLDSLMAVELKNRIEGDLGVEVPLVAFLEGVSIAELSSQVADGIESAPAMAAAAMLDVAELWEMEDWDQLLASIDRMTAEDLDFLLAELSLEG